MASLRDLGVNLGHLGGTQMEFEGFWRFLDGFWGEFGGFFWGSRVSFGGKLRNLGLSTRDFVDVLEGF